MRGAQWFLDDYAVYGFSLNTYMDLDFAELAYSIHPTLRFKGFLTVEWIKNLNPEAGNFPWAKRHKANKLTY